MPTAIRSRVRSARALERGSVEGAADAGDARGAAADRDRTRLRTEIRRDSRAGERRTGQRRRQSEALVPPRQREDIPVPLDRSGAVEMGGEARRRRCCSTAKSSPSMRTDVRLDSRSFKAGFTSPTRRDVERIEKTQPVALIAFDILRHGDEDVRGESLTQRRVRLKQVLGKLPGTVIRISEQVEKDGRAMHERAIREGWEGLIVKEALRSVSIGPSQPGVAQAEGRQRAGVRGRRLDGTATEPAVLRCAAARRPRIQTTPGGLKYVGHTGTGFDARSWRESGSCSKRARRNNRRSPNASRPTSPPTG